MPPGQIFYTKQMRDATAKFEIWKQLPPAAGLMAG